MIIVFEIQECEIASGMYLNAKLSCPDTGQEMTYRTTIDTNAHQGCYNKNLLREVKNWMCQVMKTFQMTSDSDTEFKYLLVGKITQNMFISDIF